MLMVNDSGGLIVLDILNEDEAHKKVMNRIDKRGGFTFEERKIFDSGVVYISTLSYSVTENKISFSDIKRIELNLKDEFLVGEDDGKECGLFMKYVIKERVKTEIRKIDIRKA